ncbi:hypothetical protein SAMN05421837_107683 [Amycolatopsis pretoriensis]|uniref:Uncharacterized protein n=2 Tax=Amycolatopsis pretoriensis TaxID=218821 RepID=A0A1H5RBQ4_9PSEU|nr:hypothetical protein SAMN05421837_107683 [Amycolatopsis pretoriensis]
MAVKRGFIYKCPFGSNGFTSRKGDEVVVVLVEKYGDGGKECLVAGARQNGPTWEADLDHVYTVVSDKLKGVQPLLSDRDVVEAKKHLGERIRTTK